MNIRDALLEVHSKAQATKIADHVGNDPERFAELMNVHATVKEKYAAAGGNALLPSGGH